MLEGAVDVRDRHTGRVVRVEAGRAPLREAPPVARRAPGQGATRRRRATPGVAVLAAGLAAVAIALAADVGNVLSAQEQDTVALRYQLRGEQPVDGITLVAIDDASISHLGVQWPFRRSLHARADRPPAPRRARA